MTTARAISIPLPEDLPFINKWFKETMVKAEDEAHGMVSDSWPGMIDDDLVATLDSFEESTFSALMTALRPTVNKSTILSRKDLEVAADQNGSSYRSYFVEDGDFDDFTDEQLQVWLLLQASYPKDIDWRVVVSLYNDSAADQKEAIDGFFQDFRHLSLESLVNAGGWVLNVPECLYSNDTRSVDGHQELLCKISGEWMRDDKFHTQFFVTSKDGMTNTADNVGYCGTIEQAIAKATLFTQSHNGFVRDPSTGKPKVLSPDAVARVTGSVSIWFRDVLVAEAELERRVEKTPDLGTAQDCKLSWGERKAGPIGPQQFRKALWSTEKLIGVQWSKVRHLENDLGM